MDKTKETKNSPTLNTTNNCNPQQQQKQQLQQPQQRCGISSKSLNSDDNGTSNINNLNNHNTINDLATITTMKSNNHHDHNNKNQGCGSQILSSSPSSSSISSTAAVTTTTTKVLNNYNKSSTTTSTSAPTPTPTASSLLSIQNSNIFKPLPKTVISSSSAAAAAAAALSMNSTITSSTTPSLSSSTATTILNGVQTSITQLGTPLPSALQQQANLANLINLNINTTTGGNFGVTVDPSISVENLKKIISKKLKVAKDRICLLHREKELQDGTLKDNNLMDGSRIILIPNVETGLLAQRPENTVMQALESLNDSQVNDFLSGKTPLNLSMRLGDHMMLIQLQLSTVNPANNANAAAHHHHHHHHHHHAGHGINCPRLRSSTQRACNRSNLTLNGGQNQAHHHHQHPQQQQFNNHSPAVPTMATRSSSSSAVSTSASQITSDNPQAQHQQQQQLPSLHNLQMQQHHQIIRLRQSLASSAASSSTNIISSSGGTVTGVGIGASSTNSRNGNQNAIAATSSASNNYTTQQRNPFKHSFGTVLSPSEYESLHKIVQSITGPLPSRNIPNIQTRNTNSSALAAASAVAGPSSASTASGPSIMTANSFHSVTPPNDPTLLEQSPIKSLSNLVSSPIKTTAIKNIPITSQPPHTSNHSSSIATNNLNSSTPSVAVSSSTLASDISVASSVTSTCQQDPIAAKLTSCLCTRLNSGSSSIISNKHCIDTTCLSRQDNSTLQIPNQSVQQLQQRNILITSTPNIKSQILTAAIPATASATTTSSSIANLHKTANNPIARSKQHSRNHQAHHYQQAAGGASASITSTTTTSLVRNSSILPNIKLQNSSTPRFSSNSNDSGFGSDDSMNPTSTSNSTPTITSSNTNDINNGPPSTPSITSTTAITNSSIVAAGAVAAAATTTTSSTSTVTPMDLDDTNNITMTTDTRTLAEASRNLTQTLRKLSKEVFTNKIDLSACNDESSTLRRSNGNSSTNGSTNAGGTGAVIESMKNHGKGIYSGTFSGTLNPALQDRYGRPKRDISTVIHILNDLLSATPQYSRGARISLETPSSSSSTTSLAAGAANTNISVDATNVQPNSRSKQISAKHHSHHSCIKCIKAAAQHQVNSQAAGSSSSSTCTYGECNGHYSASKTIARPVSYPCCLDVPITTNGVTPVHGTHNVSAANMDKNICTCRYRIHSESGEREREYTCQKCTHDMDNMKTKSKMNQIRLVMQQSKQKREARKLKGSPYGPRLSNGVVVNNTANNSADVSSNDTEMVPATGESTKTTSTAALNNATAATTLATTATSAATSEVSPNHLVEEVDTAA